MGREAAQVAKVVTWPDGARFAFAIFDDADSSTLENAPLIYELLTELGFRGTKTVWPTAPEGPAWTGGSTCSEPEYLEWVKRVQAAGHEIGYHIASAYPSTRPQTITALDRFKEMFGHDRWRSTG